MKCLILLAAFLAVVAAVPVSFQNCGSSSDQFQVTSIDATSWPPKAGAEESVTINGNLLSPLSKGSYSVQVKFDGFPITNLKGDISDLGLVLPASAGPHTLVKNISLPSFIPSGTLEIVITAQDSNGNQLTCAQASTKSKLLTDTPIPFTVCGDNTYAEITTLTASVWPPVQGQPLTVSGTGTLKEDLTAGKYHADVTFDGIPIKSLDGDLSELVTLPLKAGPLSISKTVTVPSVGLSGTVALTIKVTDQNGNQIGCVQVTAQLGSAIIVFDEIQHLVTDSPVPYTLCGDSTYLQLDSITASVWPPVQGQSLTISGSGTLKEDLTDGKYHADVSFDGIPIKSLDGSLSDLGIQLPLKAGPISLSKSFTVPSVGLSGTIALTIKVTDQNGNQIACVQVTAQLSSALSNLQDVPVPFTLCGPDTYADLTTLTASVWPPVQGQPLTISGTGTLKEDLTAGKYHADVTFDGIPIKSLDGDLSELVTLPLKAGPLSISKTVTVPSVGLSGSVAVTIKITDQSGNQIGCVQVTAQLASTSLVLVDAEPMLADTPVPFTLCAPDTYADLTTLTASVWPPVQGQPLTISGTGTLKEDLTAGKYHADVTFDGIPIKSLDGDLSELVTLPLKAGPLSISKTVTVPSVGLSGTVALTIKITDQSANEIGCVQVTTQLGSKLVQVDSRVAEFQQLLQDILNGRDVSL